MTDPLKTVLVALAMAAAPVAANAQTKTGEPPPDVRVRIGPLFLNPTLNLSNAGRDTNVFNAPTNPQEDFTVTITPAADIWLRFGPTWLQSNVHEDLVWFQKFANERSANNSYSAKWTVPLNRVTATPQWAYTNTRERPGFEIDARAEHTEMTYGGTLDYRLLTKTYVGVEAHRTETTFAEGTMFLGADLSTELNRTVTIGTLNIRHDLTPLTSINLSGSVEQDRFEFDPLRNADSRGIAATVRFDPAALIKGSATIGYRDFKPASPDVPAYEGSTLGVDLTYVLLGVTRFAFNATRDVQYSFDVNQPYYLLTGGGGSIGQQIFGPIDVVVRGALRRLEYRDRLGAPVAVANREDRVVTYGGGVGYHLGRETRIALNVDHSRRESEVSTRQYMGWTYGVAVTYGTLP